MAPATTTSFDLIERIKKGDRGAFNPLFEKYRSKLAIVIYCRMSPQLRAAVDIDDLLQETFLRAFKEFDDFTYRSPGSYMRWMSRIAEHVVVDAARHQGRGKRRPEELLPFRSPSNPQGADPADSRTPSRILSGREKILMLIDKMEALPEKYRQAILLSKVQGFTTQEIAEQMGVSRENAALLLCRALKQLRHLLGSPSTP